MGAVELSFAAEPAGAEFHWAIRRDLRQRLLLFNWGGVIPSRRSAARIRSGKIVSFESAPNASPSLAHPVRRVRRLLAAIANPTSAGLEARFQYSGFRRMGRLRLRQNVAASFDGQNRIDHSSQWNLRRQSDPDDRIATDPSRSTNCFRHA